MEYTFVSGTSMSLDNGNNISWGGATLNNLPCKKVDNSLKELQFIFDTMKKNYIKARNSYTANYIDEYGEEEVIRMINERYPKPVNIDELASQARIISKKYEIYGTTSTPDGIGFIFKVPNVRVRCRVYINLGDYYCWVIKKGIDSFILRIYQALPSEKAFTSKEDCLVYGGSGYPHPHISGHSPCLGGFESPIKVCSGHFNMVGVLTNISKYLNSYYGRSTYQGGSYYKPYKLITLKTDNLEKLESNEISYSTWAGKKYTRDEIKNLSNEEWDSIRDKFHSDYPQENISLNPHELWFYNKYFDRTLDWLTHNSQFLLKLRLLMKKFKEDNYLVAIPAFIRHIKSASGTNIDLNKELPNYCDAYFNMYEAIYGNKRYSYYIGWTGGQIKRDTSFKESGITSKFQEIKRLIKVSEDTQIDIFTQMTCKDFWKYLSQFKNRQEFVNAKNENTKERISEIKDRIDKLYPEFLALEDSFNRKILITLDKQKRRLLNELNHTLPATDAHQLSFEALSKD